MLGVPELGKADTGMLHDMFVYKSGLRRVQQVFHDMFVHVTVSPKSDIRIWETFRNIYSMDISRYV